METVLKEQRDAGIESVVYAVRGDTFTRPYRSRDKAGNPRDLSRSEFEMEVRYSAYDNTGTPLLTNPDFILGQSKAAIDYDAALGNAPGFTMDEVHVKVDWDRMNIFPGEWVFDFRETTYEGDRITRDAGVFVITKDVSSATSYPPGDTTRPQPSFSSEVSSPATASPVLIEIDLGEPSTDFTIGDLVAEGTSNPSLQNLTPLDERNYRVEVVFLNDGDLTLSLAAESYTDAAGNPNKAAVPFELTYDAPELLPLMSSGEDDPTNVSPIVVTIDLAAESANFVIGNIVAGGTASPTLQNLTDSGDGQVYTVEVVPANTGSITLDIPAGRYTDLEGTPNVAAAQLAFDYDADAPAVNTPQLSIANETDTSFDLVYEKATGPDASLYIYRAYRAPEDADLSTPEAIASNGTEIDSGTDVNTLSSAGVTPGDLYEYIVTVEDPTGNVALYAQRQFETTPPTVSDVSINENFSYQDIAAGPVQLSAEIIAVNVENLTLNWMSLNTEVATVVNNGDGTAIVTPVVAGEVTIRAESDFDNSEFDELTFTIYEFSAFSEESQFTTEA